jgi:hypothetical protein
MNKSFKSVDEVKKHLDSVSEGPAGKNTQPAGSVWHPQRKFDTTCVKPTGRTPEEEEHCRMVQKKQLEQYPASADLKKLKIGETAVVGRDKFHDTHVKGIMDALQNLEEISGPDTLEGYIEILTEVKKEIEKRLSIAAKRLKDEK